MLTIKSASGLEVSFHVSAKTVAETSMGAVEGYKFDLDKGEQVRVTAATVDGNETALFIVPAV
jgi:hypothetical protein